MYVPQITEKYEKPTCTVIMYAYLFWKKLTNSILSALIKINKP